MSISSILLGLWLILVGSTWLTWIDVSLKFLGLLAFITGILWLIEAYHPIVVKRP